MNPILIAAGSAADGQALITDLRDLGRLAVCVENAAAALPLLAAGQFAAIVVVVKTVEDWKSCAGLAAAANCPVAVVSNLLAPDRRYRQRAFASGVAAYLCEPCTKGKLRAMLLRLHRGETGIELTEGARYSEWS